MRWTIEMNGKGESGKSVLATRHEDDDIYIYIYNYDCYILTNDNQK